MPGSKRTFNYTIVPKDVQTTDKVLAQARRVLGWACDGDKRITCHDVTGAELGAVTLSMTIHGRDRWWSTQLAQDILNIVLWGLETGATRLELDSRKQDPHTHRGYAHGRTKPYRSSRPFKAAASSSSTPDTEDATSTEGSTS